MATLGKNDRIPGWAATGAPDAGIPWREPQPPMMGEPGPIGGEFSRVLGWTAEVHIFDLSEEEGLKGYRELLDKVGCSPFSRVSFVDRRWIEEVRGWKILVEVENKVRIDVPFNRQGEQK